jgi:hypothetical protein
MIRFDTDELVALSVDLGKTARRTTGVMTKVFAEGADDLVKTWARNARETSGAHGKHYPNSIDSERLLSTGIAFEVGPNPAKPQGNMAFETGSANQPPHPDGQRAADQQIPLLQRRIDIALNSDLGL